MVEKSQNMSVEISCGELFEIVSALVSRAEMFVKMSGPAALINQTISRAEKLNKILKDVGYDYYEKEIFINLKAGIRNNESIQ